MRIFLMCIIAFVFCFSCGRSDETVENISLVGFCEKDGVPTSNSLNYSRDTFETQIFDTTDFNVVRFGFRVLIEFMADRLGESKHVIDSLNNLDIYKKEELVWTVFKHNSHIQDSINCRLIDSMNVWRDEWVSKNPEIIECHRIIDSVMRSIRERNDSVCRVRTQRVW